jgi:excisionase family DNA binding protein
MSGLDELLTADDVAEILHVPRSTVSDYARRGVLPSIKLGRHVRFVAPTSPKRSNSCDWAALRAP